MIEALTNNHYEEILELLDGSEKCIKIISPFLSEATAKKLCDCIKSKPDIKCTFITRFYLEDFLSKVSNLDALEMMIDCGIEVCAVRGLHTKLYLFDESDGVLGSANFTLGGFVSNIELSLHIHEEVDLLNNLHSYFDNLLEKIKESVEGLVTKNIIVGTRERYQNAYKSRKSTGNKASTFMYGAESGKHKKFEKPQEILNELELCKLDIDIIHEMFKETEKRDLIQIDHNIWLKFGGEGNDRIFGKYPSAETFQAKCLKSYCCVPGMALI